MRHQPEFHRDVARGRHAAWTPPRRARSPGWLQMLLGMMAAGGLGWSAADWRVGGGSVATRGASAPVVDAAADEALPQRRFGLCHSGGGRNCVVDGDTFWVNGERIRIADIDAPETHPPRCAHEAELGDRATERLQALLGAAPLVLAAADRDTDRYGRKLRVVLQDGVSVGERLVDEGLARRWEGRRRPWC